MYVQCFGAAAAERRMRLVFLLIVKDGGVSGDAHLQPNDAQDDGPWLAENSEWLV
jgi:hypothetical protein